MSDSINISAAQDFLKRLEHEIICQAESINQQPDDGDLQDGFLLDKIVDGWIAYKGMSWGFVLVPDPFRLSMTFGTHGPFGLFSSHGQVLRAEADGQGLVWVDETNPNIRFADPAELAAYGLQALAAEVRDELPEMPSINNHDSQSAVRRGS